VVSAAIIPKERPRVFFCLTKIKPRADRKIRVKRNGKTIPISKKYPTKIPKTNNIVSFIGMNLIKPIF